MEAKMKKLCKSAVKTATRSVDAIATTIDIANDLLEAGQGNIKNWLKREAHTRAIRDSMAYDRLFIELKKEQRQLDQEIADAEIDMNELIAFNPYRK